jgi:hypothetical protein
MQTVVHKFLMSGTGPTQFRSALRRKSLYIRQLAHAGETLNSVRVRIPESVSGGEIFELMSGRLRELLQTSDGPDDTMWRAERVAPWNPNPTKVEPREKLFETPRPILAPAPSTSADFAKAGESAGLRDPSATPSGSRDSYSSKFSSLPPDHIGDKPVQFEAIRGAGRRHNNEIQGVSSRRRHGTRLETSVFLKALGEYWQVHGPERADERSTSTSSRIGNAAERQSPGPSDPLIKAKTQYEVASRDAADKLRAFVSGNQVSTAPMSNASAAVTSETAVTQNVFNIAVQGGVQADASLEDFSTKLAGILREQALLHGIDIT